MLTMALRRKELVANPKLCLTLQIKAFFTMKRVCLASLRTSVGLMLCCLVSSNAAAQEEGKRLIVAAAGSVGAVPTAWVQAWGQEAQRAGQIALTEPNQAEVQTRGGNTLVVRYESAFDVSLGPNVLRYAAEHHLDNGASKVFEEYTANPLVTSWITPSYETWIALDKIRKGELPTADLLLANTSLALGWQADQEELLAFPLMNWKKVAANDRLANYADYRQSAAGYYLAHRQAAGLSRQYLPLPSQSWFQTAKDRLTPDDGYSIKRDGESFGDVSRNRMLLVTLADIFGGAMHLDGRLPGAGEIKSYLEPGTTEPTILGYMHAHVLMNALAEGGTPVPRWMQQGLAILSSQQVLKREGFPEGDTFFTELTPAQARSFVGERGAIGPKQWPPQAISGGLGGDEPTLPEAESQLLMRFFYTEFGPGAVVETLQRLGSGQSVDAALQATTGLTEAGFFKAWLAAETKAQN